MGKHTTTETLNNLPAAEWAEFADADRELYERDMAALDAARDLDAEAEAMFSDPAWSARMEAAYRDWLASNGSEAA